MITIGQMSPQTDPMLAPSRIAERSPRSAYVGVSTDVKLGLPVFTFTDHKIFTGPVNASLAQIFAHAFPAPSRRRRTMRCALSSQGCIRTTALWAKAHC